jgi:hypothetical protein
VPAPTDLLHAGLLRPHGFNDVAVENIRKRNSNPELLCGDFHGGQHPDVGRLGDALRTYDACPAPCLALQLQRGQEVMEHLPQRAGAEGVD